MSEYFDPRFAYSFFQPGPSGYSGIYHNVPGPSTINGSGLSTINCSGPSSGSINTSSDQLSRMESAQNEEAPVEEAAKKYYSLKFAVKMYLMTDVYNQFLFILYMRLERILRNFRTSGFGFKILYECKTYTDHMRPGPKIHINLYFRCAQSSRI